MSFPSCFRDCIRSNLRGSAHAVKRKCRVLSHNDNATLLPLQRKIITLLKSCSAVDSSDTICRLAHVVRANASKLGTQTTVKKQSKSAKLLIGNQLKELRVANGFLQGDLANAIGVKESAISNLERNKTEPKASHMAALADFLGVTMDRLRDPKQRAHVGSSAVLTQPRLEQLLSGVAKLAAAGDPEMRAEVDRLLTRLSSRAGVDADASLSSPPTRRKKG